MLKSFSNSFEFWHCSSAVLEGISQWENLRRIYLLWIVRFQIISVLSSVEKYVPGAVGECWAQMLARPLKKWAVPWTIFLRFLVLERVDLSCVVVTPEPLHLWDYFFFSNLMYYYVLIVSIIILPANENRGALSLKRLVQMTAFRSQHV